MADQHGHRLAGTAASTALSDLGFAALATGVIARRRRVMGLPERANADARVLTRMRALPPESGSSPRKLSTDIPMPLISNDFGIEFTVHPAPFPIDRAWHADPAQDRR
ncbi:hypothetical protein [Nocardia anaemiae]|uniref:hypothetical protein n=1 Tax=Nocardia anaemiae TaxID=263910 RepID=UPI0007A42C74|nr:hypothetical protein [Nocardia anaemiae]